VDVELGKFGVWTSYHAIGEENAGSAAQLVEKLGFSVFWLGGSPKVPALWPLVNATEQLVAATGILNIWINDSAQAALEFDELWQQFPNRLMLGVGVGHPEATSDYTHPLAAMSRFFDGLDASPKPPPEDRRCMAALGPKMLDLCVARSMGAHTYFVPVEHTRFARERMGAGALLAPELACVVDDDVERARAKARKYAALYLGLRNYTGNLLTFGFTESDIADGGSDRLIDAVIPHGTAHDIAAVAHEHLAAGADHVCLQPVGVKGVPEPEWTTLAGALGLPAGD
jgi:probable F420-dependent oxidoreductase